MFTLIAIIIRKFNTRESLIQRLVFLKQQQFALATTDKDLNLVINLIERALHKDEVTAK